MGATCDRLQVYCRKSDCRLWRSSRRGWPSV